MTTTAPTSAVRASDAEREDVAELLREQAAAGRLTMAEFEERMAAAYHARTREELRQLTMDLPAEETHPMDRRPSSPIEPCLLCLLLCICPPAGLVYLLIRRRNSHVHEPLDGPGLLLERIAPAPSSHGRPERPSL
jgi:hypothetical protein